MSHFQEHLKAYRQSPDLLSHDRVLNDFLEVTSEKKLTLYPAQEEAILALIDGQNVILNTPTGSGKSLVALAHHFKSIAYGRRSIYTCPIKALVNEKFLSLCREFGAENVGMITGDATVHPEAPILCVTAEILANYALRDGAECPFDDIILDEFHYYSDRERGVAWQIPLLTLSRAQFLLMSATLGDVTFFEKQLTQLTGRPTARVHSQDRPVPLEFHYSEIHLEKTILDLISKGRAPVYVVNFSQREAHEVAQNLLSSDFSTKEEKKNIAEEIRGVDFKSPLGKDLPRLLKHGVGIHHAGLLPKYRILVERLAQKGMLKVICGTDTLGVGVNVPIRSVLFTKLCKYDGEKTTLLSARDFHQISGRAGRKGFDDLGTVVAQAPEHVIENLKLEEKAGGDPAKLRKIVKRKPPERGYIPWNKDTFVRLTTAQPEPLVSRFGISQGMLLNVLSRGDVGCTAMKNLIADSHESAEAKCFHRKRAFQLFRALLERHILEIKKDAPVNQRLRLNVELQDDFSLHQTLALFVVDTVQLLDPQSETYALDVLTLCESVAENPDVILRKQLDRIKTEKMAEMKAQGMEYEERIEALDKLEYPKPNADFIYTHFNEFARKHPWIEQENIRPKSIVREMFETFQSFADYIREYDLERSEGLLLRYLSEVYKTLTQTVPDSYKTEDLKLIESYLESMIREIDSSLLEEWENLKNLTQNVSAPVVKAAPLLTTGFDESSLTVSVRNAVFRFVRACLSRDIEAAMSDLEGITRESLEKWWIDCQRAGVQFRVDSRVRATEFCQISKQSDLWKVTQSLLTPDGDVWGLLEFSVSLAAAAARGRPLLKLNELPDPINE